MDRFNELKKLKQDYIILKELIKYYEYAREYNDSLVHSQEKENVKAKKLVLTKPFYGKNLVVG